ncbi:unnamed protein product [Paramecium sonneborni]|uniref:Uncharacterized protein n=1 Tax=Paramecium sonneborni TaxID=65129 RepID=A0A8S1P4G3_9CILI|nr:unnamed protein product [Paramecium sonneborni]
MSLKIILIQKNFRKNKRGILIANQAINVSLGLGYSENCQIYKTDLAELICQQFFHTYKNKYRDASEKLENRNFKYQNGMEEVLSNQ